MYRDMGWRFGSVFLSVCGWCEMEGRMKWRTEEVREIWMRDMDWLGESGGLH